MMSEAEILDMLRTQYADVTGPFKTHDDVTYFRVGGKPLTIHEARKIVGDTLDEQEP
jgi:hypothetical protein